MSIFLSRLRCRGERFAKFSEHQQQISFTGSIATGKKIQIAAAASNLKRVTLELGKSFPC
jgi:acyl-CoA reductase-like NAD-dependent aldehyde dehydrogenase